MGQTRWSAILHSGLAAAFQTVFISARQHLLKSACLCLYMCLMQGGEGGKRGTNCTLAFTRHWTTFFGTRVQTRDLSCQGMIHAVVSRCQKEKES